MIDWRRATPDDAGPLTDLERDANLVGLAHVFGELPFPYAGVLSRWALVLDDPEVVTEVVDGDHGLLAFAAYDAESLRHLAVHPDAWGTGLATAGVRRAVHHGVVRLWVLAANRRARGLYEHLGWRPTGVEQECPWVPHPTELEYALVGSRA
ncbi:GNAT family N-acetyltransferase [Nocardioides sp.]|uniref:GNAT family N-acetyltransferase n=1 Tax=Nocardioides sp. TaxID=35761 RepID=UPI002BEDD388|nr:GNAT family N-acetyltransferase [Nocardioides sp.]HXH78004.1 GNAT family N-acetyltransferase [Nocardioides sp.]